MKSKKKYGKPGLEIYGTIEKLTKNLATGSADTPKGDMRMSQV